MMHRHIPTPAGRFAVCAGCQREPRHYLVLGTSVLESMQFARPLGVAQRHMLECNCGRKTAKYATLAQAEAEWGPLLSQIPLALPTAVVPIRPPARSARRKEVRHANG